MIPGGPYYLTLGPIDCTNYYDVHFVFERWLNTDVPEFVWCNLECSNNGSDWTLLWENTGTVTDNQWQNIEYDISSVADDQSSVFIRWGYEIKSDRAYQYSGWNIDDITFWGFRK